MVCERDVRDMLLYMYCGAKEKLQLKVCTLTSDVVVRCAGGAPEGGGVYAFMLELLCGSMHDGDGGPGPTRHGAAWLHTAPSLTSTRCGFGVWQRPKPFGRIQKSKD